MRKLVTQEEIEANFWSKVDIRGPNECWPWTAALSHGYGIFMIHGKAFKAHRMSWLFSRGKIPKGLLIRHYKCGYRPCCNPAHLKPGTYKQNQDDTLRMGRVSCGESHPVAILSSAQVTWIRQTYLRKQCRVQELIAKLKVATGVSVCKNSIYDILRGHTWDHQDQDLIAKILCLPRLKADHRGELNGHSKMTEFLVYELRLRASTGQFTHRELGKLFDITPGMVGHIVHGIAWKHTL